MAISSISSITLPNGSTYALKDASLRKAGVLSGDGADIIGVDEVYFRPTIKVFDAAPVRSDLSVIKLSADEYMELVASDSTLSNALYVVEDSYKNAYGQQIKNLAPGTELSDAVNFEQLSEVSARAADTYTKTETDQKIANAQYFKKYIVESLPPLTAADDHGIYLVPSTDSELSNVYDEYVVVGEGAQKAWEKIGAKNIDLSGYKTKQTAKTSPAASSTATAFIDTITQNENGEITATKKTVQTASTSQAGIVQLNNTVTSTSTSQAATANAVKVAYDLADSRVPSTIQVAGQALTADVTAAAISSAIGLSNYVPKTRKVNNKQLSGDITLNASDVSALALSGGTVTGSIAATGDIVASSKVGVQLGNAGPYLGRDPTFVEQDLSVGGYLSLTHPVHTANETWLFDQGIWTYEHPESANPGNDVIARWPNKNGRIAVDADLSNYVPTSRKVNNKQLSSDITLGAADVGAVSLGGDEMTGELINDIGLVSPYWSTTIDYHAGIAATNDETSLYVWVDDSHEIYIPATTQTTDYFMLSSHVPAAVRYQRNAPAATGNTPTITLADRCMNVVSLASTVTAVTINVPANSCSGCMRDMFLNLTITSTGTTTVTMKNNNSAMTISFGSADLAKIMTGKNLIYITEVDTDKFLVSVKHED